jgi:hypothetical protein
MNSITHKIFTILIALTTLVCYAISTAVSSEQNKSECLSHFATLDEICKDINKTLDKLDKKSDKQSEQLTEIEIKLEKIGGNPSK